MLEIRRRHVWRWMGLVLFVVAYSASLATIWVWSSAAPAPFAQAAPVRQQPAGSEHPALDTYAPASSPTPGSGCGPASDYTVTSVLGASIVGGTVDTGNHGDEFTTTITLPFPYSLYDQTFTQAVLGSNGILGFVANTNPRRNYDLPYAGYNYAIFPHWDDMRTDTPGSGIYTSVSGVEPGRIFNIEWRATLFASGGAVNFEVRLYEGQSRFDIVYGSVSNAGNSATVGVQKAPVGPFTTYSWNSPALQNGLLLTFAQPACPTATGTSTPTPTGTGTSTNTPVPPTNTRTPTRTSTNTRTRTSTRTPTATWTPMCSPSQLFSEDFESGTLGGFANVVPLCESDSCDWQPVTDSGGSGLYAAFAPDGDGRSDQQLTLGSSVDIPAGAGSASLLFSHRYEMQNFFDGGVLEVSTDGGANWADIGESNFLAGGYTTNISNCCASPIALRRAWSGNNPGWPGFSLVKVNLLPYAGQSLLFRFRMGTDEAVGGTGWWIDDISITIGEICPTSTATATSTSTPTSTPCPACTNTPTRTNTPTNTRTSTNTPPATATRTNTQVNTNTNTPVPTATSTSTPCPACTSTNTPVATATNTPVATATSTNTQVNTNTNTPVPTATSTSTPCPACTNTNTPVATATNTSTGVATNTLTPTRTNTVAPTNTNTAVSTSTNTPVATATRTNTAVPTNSNTRTSTATPTITPTPTPTCSTGFVYRSDETPGGTIDPGGKQIVPDAGCDDCFFKPNLPFNFDLYGVPHRDIYANANGFLVFADSPPPPDPGNVMVCLSTSPYDYAIYALWDDLDMRPGTCGPDCGVYTSTTGAVPNRVFNIEWRACVKAEGACAGSVNFEIRLFEGQDRFDVVYATTHGNAGNSAIGVYGAVSPFTEFSCIRNSIYPPVTVSFTQPCPLTTSRLLGHVTWGGLPLQPHPAQQQPLTLTLKMGATTSTYGNRLTDPGGFFTLPVTALPAGTYDWWTKGAKHLANGGTISLTGASTVSAEMGLLRPGDANDDNTVEVIDFNILKGTFGVAVGDPGYDDRANFDADSVVDVIDFTLLKASFGQSGAPPLGMSESGRPR